jgi:hypothetical protein
VEECDFTNVDLKRLVAMTLKACAESLKEFPELNARLEGDQIVFLDRYDLGVAVQTEQGLVVPVVRGCDSRSLDELHAHSSASPTARAPAPARRGRCVADVHRHERRQARGLFQTPIVNHPRLRSQHRPRCASARRARRRGRARAVGYVSSRSTTVCRTGARRRVRARRHSAARHEREIGLVSVRGASAPGQWCRGVTLTYVGRGGRF